MQLGCAVAETVRSLCSRAIVRSAFSETGQFGPKDRSGLTKPDRSLSARRLSAKLNILPFQFLFYVQA